MTVLLHPSPLSLPPIPTYAPGGKSLVAEVLLVRQLLRHLPGGHRVKRVFGRVLNPPPIRALLVVPFVTIVQEKTPQLQVWEWQTGGRGEGGALLNTKFRIQSELGH